VSLVARDIGARRAAERKAALLLGELDHRVKNILALVSSVVSQTLRTTTTPEAFEIEVSGRIQAIAKAHSLLTNSGQGEVSLRAILETELAPYGNSEGKVNIEGLDVVLTPSAGLAIAMALHELASNAVKYGALSNNSGKLRIRWNVSGPADAETLLLAWTEAEGPVVSEPMRRGFGTTLIERALAHELDAEVRREFAPTGLRCTIILPFNDDIGRLVQADPAGGLS
ncbi:MAG: sensor histidine kinase, partial [Janthinobacterium lividum]